MMMAEAVAAAAAASASSPVDGGRRLPPRRASHERSHAPSRELLEVSEGEEPWENYRYNKPPSVEWCPPIATSSTKIDPKDAELYAEKALGKQSVNKDQYEDEDKDEDEDRPWVDLKAISASKPHYDLEVGHQSTKAVSNLRHHRQDPPVECVGDYLTPTSSFSGVSSIGSSAGASGAKAGGCLQWGDALCREDPFAHGIWKFGIDKFDKTLKLWNPLGEVVYSDFEGVRELCLCTVAENVARAEGNDANSDVDMPFVQVHYEHGADDWLMCDVGSSGGADAAQEDEEAMMQIVEVTGSCPDHYYKHPVVEFTVGSADDAGSSAGEKALWFVDFNGGTFTAGGCEWSSMTGGLHSGSLSSAAAASSVVQQQSGGAGARGVGWGKDQFVAHGASGRVLLSLCAAVILAVLLLLTVAIRRNRTKSTSPLMQLHHHPRHRSAATVVDSRIDRIDIDMLSDVSCRESPDGSPVPRTPPKPPPHTGRSPKSHLTASAELAHEDYALERNLTEGGGELALPDTAMASLKARMHCLVAQHAAHSTGTFGYSPASSASSSLADKGKERVSPKVFIRTV